MKNLQEVINNKQPLKIDLENGVILDLIYDNEIEAYRGYWKEFLCSESCSDDEL